MLLNILLFLTSLNLSLNDSRTLVTDDRDWVKAETKKYSPNSWMLLSKYEKLPGYLEGKSSNGGTISARKDVDTYHYLEGKSKTDLLSSMATNVHEIAHVYFSLNIYPYSREHGLKLNWNYSEYDFYISPSESYFVSFPRKALFPSRKLASVIPGKLHTFRFKTYIRGNSSTQTDGVIGLLNELTAYYLGSKYGFDMLDAYKEAERSDAMGFFSWVMNLESNISAWYEFDFFIREYLLYMKKNDPGNYKLLASYKPFGQTYQAVTHSYSNLVKEYTNTIRSEMKQINSSGKSKAEIKGKLLWVGIPGSTKSKGTSIFSEDKDKLTGVLNSNRYDPIKNDFQFYNP